MHLNIYTFYLYYFFHNQDNNIEGTSGVSNKYKIYMKTHNDMVPKSSIKVLFTFRSMIFKKSVLLYLKLY